jgi:methionyl-tRNA synthetase
LTSASPETKDNDFTWKDFQSKNNNELASILGNFVNRAMVLTHKYFEGKVPVFIDKYFDETERDIFYQASVIKNNVSESVERYRLREALAEAMNLVRLGNKYLTDKEPWKVFNTDKEKCGHILNVSLQIIASTAIIMQSFLPDTYFKISKMINLDETVLAWNNFGKKDLVPANHQLNEATILFAKIEDAEIQDQIEKLHKKKVLSSASAIKNSAKDSTPNSNTQTSKSEITFDDFSKVDLKVGTIEAAEKVKGADKLLQLKVNLGSETRTIVSGIALSYSPENIIGQQVCVVTNLAPRKIKGIESKGMILMAEDESGKLKFIMPSEKINNSSSIS